MTEPLTAPEIDLRSLPYMPLDVVRLRDSDIACTANGDAFRAAVLLWCASWHQVPAASLPADNTSLARYAGYGRDLKGWAKVSREALHGFILCSDGRLYHPVVAEKAVEAWTKRQAYRDRTTRATEARRNGKSYRNDQRNDVRNVEIDTERNDHQGKVREGKGREKDTKVIGAARGSLISEDAFRTSKELAEALGKQPDEPDWVGFPYSIQAWLNDGATPDLILSACTAAAAGKSEIPHRNYFNKVVETALKERANAQASSNSSVDTAPDANGVPRFISRSKKATGDATVAGLGRIARRMAGDCEGWQDGEILSPERDGSIDGQPAGRT